MKLLIMKLFPGSVTYKLIAPVHNVETLHQTHIQDVLEFFMRILYRVNGSVIYEYEN